MSGDGSAPGGMPGGFPGMPGMSTLFKIYLGVSYMDIRHRTGF